MAAHPFDDVARTARAYMAALLPPEDLADAWHDLLADTAYWREDRPVEVLRLAHQVVVQQERVAVPAALDLLAELGVRDRGALAAILGVEVDQVVREVADDDGAAEPTVSSTAAAPDAAAGPGPDGESEPPAPAPALRIGFDGDGDGDGGDELPTGGDRGNPAGADAGDGDSHVSTLRWLVVAAIMIWTIILVLRALGVA